MPVLTLTQLRRQVFVRHVLLENILVMVLLLVPIVLLANTLQLLVPPSYALLVPLDLLLQQQV